MPVIKATVAMPTSMSLPALQTSTTMRMGRPAGKQKRMSCRGARKVSFFVR